MTSSSVKRLYASAIEDVIEGVKEAFMDEGVDVNVLLELRDLWMSKMLAMDAIEPEDCSPAGRHLYELNHPTLPKVPVFPADPTTMIPIAISCGEGSMKETVIKVPASCLKDAKLEEVLTQPEIKAALENSSDETERIQSLVLSALGEIPIKFANSGVIAASSRKSVTEGGKRRGAGKATRDSKVGCSGVSSKRRQQPKRRKAVIKVEEDLEDVVEDEEVEETLEDEDTEDTSEDDDLEVDLDDDDVDKVTKREARVEDLQEDVSNRRVSTRNRPKVNYAAFLDGGIEEMSSSDEDATDTDHLGSTDNDDDTEAETVDQSEMATDGDDETPLNSGDDDSEFEEIPDEVDCTIVCQYDKISRSKNKWKFFLKDGIMTINGVDHVFQKAVGYAEW